MVDKNINVLRISGEALLETQDEKDVYLIENGSENKVGSTTETVKFVSVDGQEVIEREQTLSSDILGNRKGIMVVEKSSFKPISFINFSDGIENLRAKYGDEVVYITSGKESKKVELIENCFDTFSVELILRVLPLKLDYSVQLNGFNATIGSDVNIYIQVLGLESVKRYSGEYVDAWKVKTYFGETIQYYWIDTTNKELLKQSSLIEKGLILEFRK